MGKTRSRKHCPHCRQSVSYSTFRQHKRRFYDSRQNRWKTIFDDCCDVYEGRFTSNNIFQCIRNYEFKTTKPLPANNLIKYKKKHTPKNNIL